MKWAEISRIQPLSIILNHLIVYPRLFSMSKGSFPGTCDVCGQSFDTQFGLQLHISRMHNDKLAGFEKCDVCGKSFMGKLHLKKHRRQGCFSSVLSLFS